VNCFLFFSVPQCLVLQTGGAACIRSVAGQATKQLPDTVRCS